jgi:hypothetical protein
VDSAEACSCHHYPRRPSKGVVQGALVFGHGSLPLLSYMSYLPRDACRWMINILVPCIESMMLEGTADPKAKDFEWIQPSKPINKASRLRLKLSLRR